jgi:hypothetical protein
LGATFIRALIGGGFKELRAVWAFVEGDEEDGAEDTKKTQ